MKLSGQIAPAAHYRMEIHAGGHQLTADEPAANGGGDAGPSPFLLVLAGLAACTGITLRMYAERHGQPDLGVRVELALEFNAGRPQIRREVAVRGGSDDTLIPRLRAVAERTPVTLALKSGFDISTTLQASGG
jgi:putative redox protein